MNLRRGVLLAGINLAVAVPVILWSQSWDAAYVRDHPVQNITAVETPTTVPPATSEEQGVVFDRCTMTDQYTLQESIIASGNAPAALLTGWRSFCPPSWSLSGRLRIDGGAPPTPSSMAAQKKVDVGLLTLIPLLWFLLGAFPISGPWRWREPGMFITLCSVLSVILFFIHPLQSFARLSVLFAFVTWFCWIVLAVWRGSRSAWRWTARRMATNGI